MVPPGNAEGLLGIMHFEQELSSALAILHLFLHWRGSYGPLVEGADYLLLLKFGYALLTLEVTRRAWYCFFHASVDC